MERKNHGYVSSFESYISDCLGKLALKVSLAPFKNFFNSNYFVGTSVPDTGAAGNGGKGGQDFVGTSVSDTEEAGNGGKGGQDFVGTSGSDTA
jgi:hypothetical protein